MHIQVYIQDFREPFFKIFNGEYNVIYVAESFSPMSKTFQNKYKTQCRSSQVMDDKLNMNY